MKVMRSICLNVLDASEASVKMSWGSGRTL